MSVLAQQLVVCLLLKYKIRKEAKVHFGEPLIHAVLDIKRKFLI